ncbi:hypothetical protein ACIPUC_14755 [Streptomyces sp. LARHCF249]
MTTDPDKAREWLEDWTDVTGVEGLVVKAMNQRYRPGARDRAWIGCVSDNRLQW